MIFYTVDKLSPEKGYEFDAGFDLKAGETVTLQPGEIRAIGTGISLRIPKGNVGLVKERSSMALEGIFVHGGVIDSGYDGEIKVIMHNSTNQEYKIEIYQRIAQLLILPVRVSMPMRKGAAPQVHLRGENGFGSTGK